MMRFALLIAASLLVALPAFASEQCYSAEEMNAEQLLRLHSELMVITVTCRQSSDGESLVPKYTGFTQTHLKALHDAEQTLIAFYDKHFGHGIDHLDKLRTKLGNEYGQEIANKSAPVFCSEHRDFVPAMYDASTNQVGLEVARLQAGGKSYGQLCTGPSTRVAHGQ